MSNKMLGALLSLIGLLLALCGIPVFRGGNAALALVCAAAGGLGVLFGIFAALGPSARRRSARNHRPYEEESYAYLPENEPIWEDPAMPARFGGQTSALPAVPAVPTIKDTVPAGTPEPAFSAARGRPNGADAPRAEAAAPGDGGVAWEAPEAPVSAMAQPARREPPSVQRVWQESTGATTSFTIRLPGLNGLESLPVEESLTLTPAETADAAPAPAALPAGKTPVPENPPPRQAAAAVDFASAKAAAQPPEKPAEPTAEPTAEPAAEPTAEPAAEPAADGGAGAPAAQAPALAAPRQEAPLTADRLLAVAAQLAGTAPRPQPEEAELAVCRWACAALRRARCDTTLLGFGGSSGYLSICCINAVLRFKPRAKKPYLIVKGDLPLPAGAVTAPCTKTEGAENLRVYYQTPAELAPYAPLLAALYKTAQKNALPAALRSERALQAAAEQLSRQYRACP